MFALGPDPDVDYEKLTIIGYLSISLWLFLKGTVMTTAQHEKILAQCRADYELRLKDRDIRIDAEKERTQEWKSVAIQGALAAKQTATAAKEIVDVVRNAGAQ